MELNKRLGKEFKGAWKDKNMMYNYQEGKKPDTRRGKNKEVLVHDF